MYNHYLLNILDIHSLYKFAEFHVWTCTVAWMR
jgi:hypothetical protein